MARHWVFGPVWIMGACGVGEGRGSTTADPGTLVTPELPSFDVEGVSAGEAVELARAPRIELASLGFSADGNGWRFATAQADGSEPALSFVDLTHATVERVFDRELDPTGRMRPGLDLDRLLVDGVHGHADAISADGRTFAFAVRDRNESDQTEAPLFDVFVFRSELGLEASLLGLQVPPRLRVFPDGREVLACDVWPFDGEFETGCERLGPAASGHLSIGTGRLNSFELGTDRGLLRSEDGVFAYTPSTGDVERLGGHLAAG